MARADEIVVAIETVLRDTGIRQRVEADKWAQVMQLVRGTAVSLCSKWAMEDVAADASRGECDVVAWVERQVTE